MAAGQLAASPGTTVDTAGNSTLGFTQVATTPAVSSLSTFTGGVGSEAYTLTDIVYMLKQKGIFKE